MVAVVVVGLAVVGRLLVNCDPTKNPFTKLLNEGGVFVLLVLRVVVVVDLVVVFVVVVVVVVVVEVVVVVVVVVVEVVVVVVMTNGRAVVFTLLRLARLKRKLWYGFT